MNLDGQLETQAEEKSVIKKSLSAGRLIKA